MRIWRSCQTRNVVTARSQKEASAYVKNYRATASSNSRVSLSDSLVFAVQRSFRAERYSTIGLANWCSETLHCTRDTERNYLVHLGIQDAGITCPIEFINAPIKKSAVKFLLKFWDI